MKFKKILLSSLLALGLINTVPASASTTWNWGGYIPTVDSPVVGGYSTYTRAIQGSCLTMSGFICTTYNYTYYTGISAFGTIAYESLASFRYSIYGSLTYTGAVLACPSNTAKITVNTPYLRSDMVSWNPTVYAVYSYAGSWGGAYMGYAAPSEVTLCVKSDNY